MTGGGVYIAANKPEGMIYTGVTAYLAERMTQHRENHGSAYCRKLGSRFWSMPNGMTISMMPSCGRSE